MATVWTATLVEWGDDPRPPEVLVAGRPEEARRQAAMAAWALREVRAADDRLVVCPLHLGDDEVIEWVSDLFDATSFSIEIQQHVGVNLAD